jgi:uncharacterized integral membrane protein
MNYIVTILLLLVSAVMVVFGAQNTQNVEISFLAYRSGNVPLSLVIVLATLGGALIVALISLLNSLRRSYRERAVRKKLERENRDLQQKIALLEKQLVPVSAPLKSTVQSAIPATATSTPSKPATK